MCLGVLERWSSPRMTWRDLHRGVVDDDREVVQRRAVAADDHEVAAEVGRVDLDLAPDEVLEHDDARCDAEAERAALARGLAGGALLGGEIRASTDVARRLVGRLLGLPIGVELLGRAVAAVGQVAREQVRRPPPRSDRAAASADTARRARDRRRRSVRALVPVDAEPVEAVEDVAPRTPTVLRATSVSSSRRMNVPPVRRA